MIIVKYKQVDDVGSFPRCQLLKSKFREPGPGTNDELSVLSGLAVG